jgi:hypothetical protein
VNELQGIGKVLVGVGVAVIILGGLLWGAGRLGLGSLPGDVRFGNERWGCYVPLASSLVLSLLLTLVLNLLWRWFGR